VDPVTFTIKRDKDVFPFSYEESASGRRMVVSGHLDHDDPLLARLHCVNLPKLREAWNSLDPQLILRSIRIDPMGGRTDPIASPARKGWCKATLIYATEPFTGTAFLRPTQPGDTWTEIETGLTSITVFNDITGAFPQSPLNGGDGVSRDVGTLTAIVKRWYGPDQQIPWTQFTSLMDPGFVNSRSIELPKVLNRSSGMKVAKGQGRYLGWTPEYDGDLVGVSHKILIAPDHLARSQIRNAEGKVVGVEERAIYGEADFAVLIG